MPITFVQGLKNTEGGAGTGDTLALTNSVGGLLVVVCGEQTSAGSITGITDTNGSNVWANLPQLTTGAATHRVFYCLNNTSGGSHTLVFTVSGTHSSFAQMGLAEFSGANTFDTNSSQQGTSLSFLSIATQAAAEVVIGAFGDGNSVGYIGSAGWTAAVGSNVPTTTTTRLGIIYAIESSQGTYTPITGGGTGPSGGYTTLGFYQVSPPAPTSIAATTGMQGTTVNVTVTGTAFDAGGTSTLSFSGTGITVNSYGTRNTTTLVANITISSSAATTARDVIVTNASTATGTLAAAFTITASVSGAYSVPDCRDYSIFPNTAVNVNGTLTYTTPTHPSVTPPTDSRTGKPVASGTYPQNSRTPGTFGPGE